MGFRVRFITGVLCLVLPFLSGNKRLWRKENCKRISWQFKSLKKLNFYEYNSRYYQNLCYSMNSWTDMTLVHSRTPLAQKKVINKFPCQFVASICNPGWTAVLREKNVFPTNAIKWLSRGSNPDHLSEVHYFISQLVSALWLTNKRAVCYCTARYIRKFASIEIFLRITWK